MIRFFLYSSFFLILFSSCEETDICTHINNNHLIINFNNYYSKTDSKISDSIYINLVQENKILFNKTIILNNNLNKISIPLNKIKKNNESLLILFSKIKYTSRKDHILMTYKLKPVYNNSQACGLQYILTDINFSLLKQINIKFIKKTKNPIDNQTKTHLIIYY